MTLTACLLASAVFCLAQNVSLEWDPNTESDLAGYNIYRSQIPGSGYAKHNAALITCGSNDVACANYTDVSVQIGIRYYYVATAVDNEAQPLESGYSNEVTFGFCLGDVNLDGSRNVLDVLQIMNHVVGNFTLTGNNLAVADTNEDGAVNVLDALVLQNHIVGNINLPACP